MADFAITKNMAISSMLFQHKRIHTETWRSLDETTSNQTDHVMIDSQHATDILDVKSCRGAVIATIIWLKLNIDNGYQLLGN
jgi:hypothetical protein